MAEVPPKRDHQQQDADAALARDPFARRLGNEWQAEEPGIYRFVGAATEPWLDGDAFELHAMQKAAARTVEDD